MKKIKVLLISPVIPNVGGISNWANKVIKYNQEHNLIDLNILDTSLRGRDNTDGRLWKRIVCGGIQAITDFLKFAVISLKIKPELVHLCTSGSFAFYKDYLICSFCNLIGVKSIVHIRFGRISEIKESNNWEWKIAQKVFRKSDCVMTIDNTTCDSLSNIKYIKKLINIPNPIDEINLPKTEMNNDKFNIVFVGWVIETKGIYELLEAFVKLEQKGVMLHILGKISEDMKRHICDFTEKNNVQDNILIYGYLPYSKVLNIVNKSDLFVLPSYTEGFPNSVLEAMMLGKAIISTKVEQYLICWI